MTQVRRFNAWNVDELIYIDITPDNRYDVNRDDWGPNAHSIEEIISHVSKHCFMPLTVGGKIRTLEDIHRRMTVGADKITLNTKAIEDPDFVTAAALRFGSQAIVVSIDVVRHEDGRYEVYSELGKTPTGKDPVTWACEVERKGAGEIFLNSVDRDGTAVGFDVELIRSVVETTRIPVIACGGAGKYSDFVEAFLRGNATAVAAGNIFHFKEMSYCLAKQELKRMKLDVR
jgi:cyclase